MSHVLRLLKGRAQGQAGLRLGLVSTDVGFEQMSMDLGPHSY